jgi:hypothetical protein
MSCCTDMNRRGFVRLTFAGVDDVVVDDYLEEMGYCMRKVGLQWLNISEG